jgi:protein TIF31
MIPSLVHTLDNLTVVPVDSEQLENVFHVHGVNMRYLGKVALQSNLLHVKEICTVDMLSRTLKRMFNG